MPLINRGGKFVFGISLVNSDLSVLIPPQSLQEYAIKLGAKVFLISGSKRSGGFVVAKKELLSNSKIGNVLSDIPALGSYGLPEGDFIKYKGRLYCWTDINHEGKIKFREEMLETLDISIGTKLLVIRSSNIAFAMGARGPLLERAKNYTGTIRIY